MKPSRRALLWLLVAGEVALILRVVNIDHTLLWYDEAFSWLVARLPLDRLVLATLGDVHPPLYYILASPFAWLGQTPMRLFSTALSLAALPLTWLLARRIGLTERAAVLAVWLMALWPSQLYYAQEARMYTLMQALLLALWICVLDRRWLLSGILSTAILYTHNFAALYVAATALIAVLAELQRPSATCSGPIPAGWYPQPAWYAQTRQAVLAFGAAFAAWAPWMLAVFAVQIPGISSGGGYWLDYLTPWTMVLNLSAILYTTQSTTFTNSPGLVLVSLGLPVLIHHAARTPELRRWLFIAALPPVVVAIVSALWRPVFLNRGFFPSVPLVLIFLAAWLVQAAPRRRAFALAFIVPALISAYIVWISTTYTGIRTMSVDYAASLNMDRTKTLVHLDESSWVIYTAIFSDMPQVVQINPCAEEPGSLTQRTRAALGIPTITAEELPESYYVLGVANTFSSDCIVQRNQAAYARAGQLFFERPLLFGVLDIYEH